MAYGLTYTGLRHIAPKGDDEIPIGEGLALIRPNETLLDHHWAGLAMGKMEADDEAKASRFLVCKHPEWKPKGDGPPKRVDTGQNRFYSGLYAIQVIKPVQTFGFIHDGNAIERRPPMDAGEWARFTTFDDEMLRRVPAMVERIQKAMNDGAVDRVNALILLQLGLEHFHPYIAGLLWVMGLEAIFDSDGRHDFKKKLCDCLGPQTMAFPDWNPSVQAPSHKVEDIAVHLYMMRNKLAHGADLRSAAMDKTTPVDLNELMQLTEYSQPEPYAGILSQSACYLLCQVLQRVL